MAPTTLKIDGAKQRAAKLKPTASAGKGKVKYGSGESERATKLKSTAGDGKGKGKYGSGETGVKRATKLKPTAGDGKGKGKGKYGSGETGVKIFVDSGHTQVLPKEECSIDDGELYTFTVEPSMKIAALKKLIATRPWTPKKKSMVLIIKDRTPRPLKDDSTVAEDRTPRPLKDDSTVAECGIKDDDTLLACIDEPFYIDVYSTVIGRAVEVQVSCFDTIWHVKEQIYVLMKQPPEAQIIMPCYDDRELDDAMPLITLGIVNPYLGQMERNIYLKVLFRETLS